MRIVSWLSLVLVGCMLVRPDPARTPVRRLDLGSGGLCSCVAIGPRQALTAGHCLTQSMSVGGQPVLGQTIGPDLALLTGRFLPPYATQSPRLTSRLVLEGFGCHGRDETRQARLLAYMPGSAMMRGLEIEYKGRACPGDSGGAIWSTDGLAGIITAYATHDPGTGFGTPTP